VADSSHWVEHLRTGTRLNLSGGAFAFAGAAMYRRRRIDELESYDCEQAGSGDGGLAGKREQSASRSSTRQWYRWWSVDDDRDRGVLHVAAIIEKRYRR
jgi:hypothetical protein